MSYCSGLVSSSFYILAIKTPRKTVLTLYQKTKNLDYSKLKEFADDKLKLNQIMNFVLRVERLERIIGHGESYTFQFFLLF